MDDSKLIELVRDHLSIFNPKHPQYKDAYVRENVWTMVAKEMKLPSEECKHRWKNIRDTYMRRKMANKLSTGSARSKKLRKWHLEEHLEFLNLVDCERETLTNMTQIDSQETQIEMQEDDIDVAYGTVQPEELADEFVLPDDHENSNISPFHSTNGSTSGGAEVQQANEAANGNNKPSNKRKPITKFSGDNIFKLFKKNSEDRAKLLSTILTKPNETQQEPPHAIDVFFQSMAMAVKKMSTERQVRAKLEICNIVGQLELEELRSNSVPVPQPPQRYDHLLSPSVSSGTQSPQSLTHDNNSMNMSYLTNYLNN